MRRPNAVTLAILAAALAAIIAAFCLLPGMLSSKEQWEIEAAATPTPTANISSMLKVTPAGGQPAATVLRLKVGSKGDSVKAVQQQLKALGYYSGEVDGQFGNGTQESVLLFQQQNGLGADGIVGLETYQLLFSGRAAACVATAPPTATPAPTQTSTTLKKGANGEAVKQLQQRLTELGYYSGSIDGDFGTGTLEAVKRFQRQNGLEPDGVVGSGTSALLYSDDAVPFSEEAAAGSQDFLILVNRTQPIDANYDPGALVVLKNRIPSSLAKLNKSDLEANPTAVDALIDMLTAAQAEGLKNWKVNAAYRTYAYQKRLFDNSVKEYRQKGYSKSKAESATRVTIADPGTSEHHTGLAFDVTVNGASQFKGTDQEKWLAKHCWEYGFIIRYQQDKENITGYIAECWHIRYVGLPHSMNMYQNHQCLEEYLGMTN